jgi:hypothetical protein
VPAPIHVGFRSEQLPAYVLEILDSKAPKPAGYFKATPRAGLVGTGRPCSSGQPGGIMGDRIAQPVPWVAPARDSAVVRSLLAARPVIPKRGGQVRAW